MAKAALAQKILSGRMTKYKGSVASIAPGLVFGVVLFAANGAFAACVPSVSTGSGTVLSDGAVCSGTVSDALYGLATPDPVTPGQYGPANVTIDGTALLGRPGGGQGWLLYGASHLTVEAGARLVASNVNPTPSDPGALLLVGASNAIPGAPELTIRSSEFLNGLNTTRHFDGTSMTTVYPDKASVVVQFGNSIQSLVLSEGNALSSTSIVNLDHVSNSKDTPLTVISFPIDYNAKGGLFGVSRLSVENGSNVYLSNDYTYPVGLYAGGSSVRDVNIGGSGALLGEAGKAGLFIDASSTVNTVPLTNYTAHYENNVTTVSEAKSHGLTILGNMSNSGKFNMSNGAFDFFELANGIPTGTSPVPFEIPANAAGNYIGNGGTIVMDVALNDDNSAHDTIWIAGSVSGSTKVQIVNMGGSGAQTENGIPLIHAGGSSNAAAFTLAAPVIIGSYEYNELKHRNDDNQLSQGKQSTTSQSWHLVSRFVEPPKPEPEPEPKPEPKPEPEKPQYQPTVPVVEVVPVVTRQTLSSFRERRAGRRYAPETTTFCKDAAQNYRCAITPAQNDYYAGAQSPYALGGTGFWVQVEGSHEEIELRRSTTGADYKANRGAVSMGFDAPVYSGETGDILLGVYGKYIKSKADVNSAYGWGEIDSDGYGAGATLTYVDKSGFYVDTQVQYARLNTDLWGASPRFLSYANGIASDAWNVSAEVGKSYDWNHGLKLTPSLRLEYAHNEYDSFQDNWGAEVNIDDADFLTLEGGLLVDGDVSFLSNTRWYAGPTLSYELLGRPTVNVAGLAMRPEIDRFWGNIAFGFDHAWNDGNASLYGDVKLGTGLQDFAENYRATARLGVNFKF